MGCEECIHANGDQALSTCHFKSPEVGTTILSIFQMREQRHREIKAFLWRHTANKGQSHTHKRLQQFCFWCLPFGKYHIPFLASKCNPSFEQLLGQAHLSAHFTDKIIKAPGHDSHTHTCKVRMGPSVYQNFPFFFFWQCCNVQILVPQSGIEPMSPVVEAQSPNQ